MYAVTVNPDPEVVVGRSPIRRYGQLSMQEQLRYFTRKLDYIVSSLNVLYCSMDADRHPHCQTYIKLCGYFELTKAGNVHFHGIYEMPEESQVLVDKFIEYSFGFFGRTNCSARQLPVLQKVCTKIQTLKECNDYRSANGLPPWEEYIAKFPVAGYGHK